MMDFYQLLAALGIDAPVLIARFSGHEALAKRFILKFPEDRTFVNLCAAMAANDYQAIENEAHALKGICLNLGMDKLGNLSSDLCQFMRAGNRDGHSELFNSIKSEHERLVTIIAQYAQ